MSWTKKLTSRKFWVALAGLVVGVIALLGIQTDTSQITGVIMALGSVIAYIVGEGLVDAAAAGGTTVVTEKDPDPSVDADGNIKVKSLYVRPTPHADAPAASDGKTGDPAANLPQAATQPESGAAASGTTGAV